MHFHAFIIASIWLTVVAADGVSSDVTYVDCPAVTYSPCKCTTELDEITNKPKVSKFRVVCDQIPIAKVKAAFVPTNARDLAEFQLHLAANETSSIPAEFLSTSSAQKVSIKCEGTYNLVIDENAFRSSKNKSQRFNIIGCDLAKQPNFAFLKGFETLNELIIKGSKNFKSFQGIPSLLKEIVISKSRDFQNLVDGPNIALPNLRILYLHGNRMGDVVAAKILKTLASSSGGSLHFLEMNGNNLTRIPEMVTTFTKLEQLWLEHNAIKSIDTQPITSSVIRNIYLSDNAISSIKPNVFGDANYNFVTMEKNKLTRLDSYVFQSMLETIALNKKKSYGSLSLYRNPIECDCHLAWLIVHKRHLLPVIRDGRCSNSTAIEDLKQENLKSCPAFTCPAGIDGKFPNPLSCTSHYTCTAGKSTLVECPAGNKFSRSLQKCDVAKNVPTCK